jgi:hypothetical protein
MRTSRTLLFIVVLTIALPSAQAMAADGWGASWSFGPVHPTSTNHIIYVRTTMVPGRLPVSYWSSSSVGPLFLWPGISNPTSDLIQTTMDAWSGSENSSYCSGNGSQWCVEASVFNGGQINGPTVAIDPDDHVTIEYKLESDGKTWTQTVTSQKLGKVVSTLQSASGTMPGGGLGFATEADADSFTVDNCYYLCSEVHLASADASFGATGVGAAGAQHGATGTGSGPGTAKNLRTPDGGLTWLVDLITLPAMWPHGTQTPAPAVDCGTDGGSGNSSGGSGGSSSGSSSGGSREAGRGADAAGGSSGSGSSGGTSGSTGSTSSGSSSGNVIGTSSGGSSGSATGASSGSPGGTGASGSGASPSSDGGGALGGSGASSSGGTSPNSAANGSEASGCSCALVGANVETSAGLTAIVLGLAATFTRRRRTTRNA